MTDLLHFVISALPSAVFSPQPSSGPWACSLDRPPGQALRLCSVQALRRPSFSPQLSLTAPLALQALLAGKDVLVEKPMALAVDEAVQLVNAARRFNRVLMVGHVMLYHPAIERLQRLFEEGALGRVQYIYANRLNLGRIRAEESVLWSFAPHDVAIMLRLLREMPQEVTCRGGTYLRPGVPDVTLTSLDFPSGVQGHIFVSWLHPFKEHRFVVVGDRHMAVVNDTGSWREVLLLYPHRVNRLNGEPPVAHKAEAVRVPLEEVQPLRVECEHFLRCVVTREQPLTDGESGVQVLRVLESAQRSLEQGGRVIRPNVSPRMEHAS